MLLVVLQFFFHPFLADEQAGDSGEQQSEFLEKRHGVPHVDEELLCVGVDEGDRELMGLGVVDGGEHFVSCVHSVLLCHALLELGEHPVDEGEVFFCGKIGGGVGVSEQDCLVPLGVEFDADDFWLFLIEDGEECCGEVEDVSGSNEGDHRWCGKYVGISLRYASESVDYTSIVDIQIDNIK